jgi:ribosome modulation factor
MTAVLNGSGHTTLTRAVLRKYRIGLTGKSKVQAGCGFIFMIPTTPGQTQEWSIMISTLNSKKTNTDTP